ncbi:MAG: amidinotransferase [Bacteroidia bacterium]
MTAQASKHLLAIRPKSFAFNTETSKSNSFQKDNWNELEKSKIGSKAIQEFNRAIELLHAHEIEVTVFEDTLEPKKPDAIFPNNWFSTHRNQVVIYPMMTPNRRAERRVDIINSILDNRFVLDLSHFELQCKYLEGTGSIVFDHNLKRAFAACSPRTNTEVLNELCKKIGYKSFVFSTSSNIYHTNVLMSIGSQYSLICKDELVGDEYLELIRFFDSSKNIIEISSQQMNAFCGNILEVRNSAEKSFVVMSETAFSSFSKTQIEAFKCEPIVVSIPTIERIGGGGIRCMLAELF